MEQSILADWIKERDDFRGVHTKAEALDNITVLDLSCKSFEGTEYFPGRTLMRT